MKQWQQTVANALASLHNRLAVEALLQADSSEFFKHWQKTLERPGFRVAIVGEGSRGKSELLNAMLFGQFGRRILPSASGRTTMCPCEFFYDEQSEACLYLLPIESHAQSISLLSQRNQLQNWQKVPLLANNAEQLQQAFLTLSETTAIPLAQAQTLGLVEHNGALDNTADVIVPKWRHAFINFPHPLLMSGLSIIDTPGLNALGNEPELSIAVIPAADVIVQVLSIDSGLSKTEHAAWQTFTSERGNAENYYFILNKIDSLNDGIRSNAEIATELDLQIEQLATELQTSRHKIFPLSAQKALLARINGDTTLLAQSRITEFETALGRQLKRAQINSTSLALHQFLHNQRWQWLREASERQVTIAERRLEVIQLYGKNNAALAEIINQLQAQRSRMAQGETQMQALREVFEKSAARLQERATGIAKTPHQQQLELEARKALLPAKLRNIIRQHVKQTRKDVRQLQYDNEELAAMTHAMRQRFNQQLNLKIDAGPRLDLRDYDERLRRITVRMDGVERSWATLLNLGQSRQLRRYAQAAFNHSTEIINELVRSIRNWQKYALAGFSWQFRKAHQALEQRSVQINAINNQSMQLKEQIDSLLAQQAHWSEVTRQIEQLISEVDALLEASPGQNAITGIALSDNVYPLAGHATVLTPTAVIKNPDESGLKQANQH